MVDGGINIFDKTREEDEKACLKKVWNSWKQFGVITYEERWRQIGQCFFATESSAGGGDAACRTPQVLHQIPPDFVHKCKYDECR